MSDFGAQLFKYLAEGERARKKVTCNGHEIEVPVFTDEQLFFMKLSKDDLWEIIMRRAAAHLEQTGQDTLSEEKKSAYSQFSVTVISKAADQPFNNNRSSHDVQHPTLQFAVEGPIGVMTAVGIRIDGIDSDTAETKSAIKKFELRGLACPD